MCTHPHRPPQMKVQNIVIQNTICYFVLSTILVIIKGKNLYNFLSSKENVNVYSFRLFKHTYTYIKHLNFRYIHIYIYFIFIQHIICLKPALMFCTFCLIAKYLRNDSTDLNETLKHKNLSLCCCCCVFILMAEHF